jgi:RNA polymerase sigma factor (sigma-70 family)
MLPEELYATYYPLLRHIAEQKFRVPEGDADDLVQEVFLKFLLSGPVEKPRPFLVAAVSNACRTYWRREAKFDRDTRLPERPRVPRYDAAADAREFLLRLPPRQRRIVVLAVRGWSMKKIARRIGCSVSWTEKLLRRAREAAAEDVDLTNRYGKGGGPPRTDTYGSCGVAWRRRRVAMIRAHVRPVRGPALPRAADRASVLCAHRRAARQVRGELSGARGVVPASRGAA